MLMLFIILMFLECRPLYIADPRQSSLVLYTLVTYFDHCSFFTITATLATYASVRKPLQTISAPQELYVPRGNSNSNSNINTSIAASTAVVLVIVA